MKNLRDFLELEVVKDGIKSNLLKEDSYVNEAISKTLRQHSNNVNLSLSYEGKEVYFSSVLNYGKNNNVYLLETRLFDENDVMINAYLQVFDENLKVVEGIVDDVWEYDDFNPVKTALLCCKNKNTGEIIARHCLGDTLDEIKNDFMEIIKNIAGKQIEGSFRDNFKIISKELV